MGEPALNPYDNEEQSEGRYLNARERASQRWGMDQDAETTTSDSSISDSPNLQVLEGGGETTAKRGFAPSLVDSSMALDESSAKKGSRGRFLGINLRSRRSIAGILTSVILGGGGIVGLNLASGPFELINIAHILGHTSAKNESDSEDRLGHMMRDAKAYKEKNIAYTRVGVLGRKIFIDGTLKSFNDAGVDIAYNVRGTPTSLTFDKEKFAEASGKPELARMNDKQFTEALSKFYNTKPGTIAPLDGETGKVSIDATKLNFNQIKKTTYTTNRLLGDNSVVAAMKSRQLGKFFGLGNLFHPFSRAFQQKVNDYINTKSDKKKSKAQNEQDAEKAAQEDILTEERAPVEAKAAADVKQVEDEKGSLKVKALGLGLGALALACVVKDTSGAIVDINYQRIVLPSEIAAINLEAQGSQLMYGTGGDIDPQQVQQAEKDAKQLSQSPAFQALSGEQVDKKANNLPASYQNAFSNNSTAAHIHDLATKLLGGEHISNLACSPQAAATVAAALIVGAAADAFFAPETGGADVAAAAAGAEAISQAESAVVAGTVVGAIVDHIVKANDPGKIAQDVFTSPVGGSLAAYGARAAANTTAIASGGIALDNNASTLASADQLESERQDFESKPYFARMFDPTDYQSLVGKLMLHSGGASKGVASLASSFMNIGSTFGSMLHTLTPSVSAASTPNFSGNYQWGFSQYGLPDFLLNDPALQDPWNNANQVAATLENDPSNVDRAEKCFGTKVSKDSSGVWDAVSDHDVNTNSDDYTGANCNPFKNKKASDDMNWARVIMFIADTSSVKAEDCYSGNDADATQSCKDLGADDSTTNTTATGTGSQFRISSFNILYSTSGEGDANARIQRSAKEILTNKFDVVGLQEVREDQWTSLQQLLGSNWDIYPKPYPKGAYPGQNPITWNTDRFQEIDEKAIPGHQVHGEYGDQVAVEVKLQDKTTGQQFYVINSHEPVGKGTAPQARYDSAELRLQQVKALQAEPEKLPIFLTGDWNAKYTAQNANQPTKDNKKENLSYCLLTTNSGLWDAYDASKNLPGACPSYGKIDPSISGSQGPVDHIYMSTDVTAQSYTYKDGGLGNNGSDHDTLWTDVTIPSSNAAAGTGSAPVPYQNAVFSGNTPDPTVIRADDGTYNAYTTGEGLQHLTSTDLVNWKRAPNDGHVITGAPSSATGNTWAPDVQKTGDHYTLSWAGSPPNSQTFSIYYGTSASAAGPFKYRGQLISPGYLGTYSLDPNIYMSDAGPILYYGSGGKGITAVKLNMAVDGTMTLAGPQQVLFAANPKTGPNAEWTNEGAWMQKHGDYYYLYYSVGRYDFSRPDVPAYQVHVARSKNPFGPFEKDPTPVLQGKGNALRPGHNSIATDNSGNEWMLYHAYVGSDHSDRQLMLDLITYQANGWPIVNDGYPSTTKQPDGPALGASLTSNQATQSVTSTIDGVQNFRDAAASSTVLKSGVLYRSGKLNNASDDGETALAKLLGSSGTIVDVRTADQRDSAPDPKIKNTKDVSDPIAGITDQAPMVTDPARRKDIAKALKTAEKAKGTVLVHCIDGKDRTGWIVAMIMYDAGATDSQVMTEYMDSSAAFPEGVKETWLNSGINAIHRNYGSVPNYLKKGLGLKDNDLTALRQKFGSS